MQVCRESTWEYALHDVDTMAPSEYWATDIMELVDHAMKEGEPLVSCDPTFYATFKTADGGILFSCPSYETTTELV